MVVNLEQQLRRNISIAEATGKRQEVASAWHALGEWLEPLRPDEEAAACYERALAARPGGRRSARVAAEERLERSLLAMCDHNYPEAAQQAEHGIRIAEAARLGRAAALLLYAAGRAVRRIDGRKAEGERLLLEAESRLQDEPLWLAAVLEEQAWHSREQGRSGEAMELLERVVALRAPYDAPWALSHACHELGRTALEADAPDKAIRALEQAVQLREAHAIPAVRFSYHELGRAYGELHDLESAARYYAKGIEADLEAADPRGAGLSYHCWAVNALEAGNLEEAVEKIGLAIQYRLEGEDPDVRFSYWVLGRIEVRRERFDAAHAAFVQQAELSRALGDSLEEADGYLELGELTALRRDEEGARTWLEKALQTAPAHSPLASRALLALGWQALRQENRERAIDLFQSVLASEEAAGEKREMAETCRLIGDVQAGSKEPLQAIAWYERAMALHREAGAPAAAAAREAAVLRRIGRLYHALREGARAREAVLKALDLDLQAESEAVSEDYYSLGHIDLTAGDATNAINWFELCLALEEQRGDLAEAAATARTLAGVTAGAGQRDVMLRWLQKAVDLSLAGEDWEQAGEASAEVSHVLRDQGDTEGAAHSLQRALELFRKAGQRRADPLFQMGHLLAESDPDAAEEWYAQALETALQEEDLSDAGAACYWSGRLCRARGDLSGAGLWFEKALAYTEASQDRAGTAFVARELGQLHILLQDYDSARNWLDRARSIHEDLDSDHEVAAVLDDLAQVALGEDRPALATEHLQQAITLLEKGDDLPALSGVTFRLGRTLAQQGELEGARTMLRQSLLLDEKIGDRTGQAVTCLELAVVALSDESFEEARSWLDRCVETGIPQTESGAMSAVQFRYGQVSEAEEDLGAAEAHYLKALDTIESPRLEAAVCLSLARIRLAEGGAVAARTWFERALQSAEAADDEELATEARRGLDDAPMLN